MSYNVSPEIVFRGFFFIVCLYMFVTSIWKLDCIVAFVVVAGAFSSHVIGFTRMYQLKFIFSYLYIKFRDNVSMSSF